jgi:hypothetical protein
MSTGQPKPCYRLTLQAQPHEVPAAIHLKRFLKFALRAFSLRCVAVEEIPGPQSGQASFGHQESLREPK